MLTGKLPYPTNKNSEVRVFIVKCTIDVPSKKIPHEPTRKFLIDLLEKDPEKRLGANGVEEIMDHEYFESIDWEQLKLKNVKPPYNPKLKGETDVRHIDSKYLDQDIVSYTMDDSDLKKGNMNNEMFEDFTYAKKDTLNQPKRQTVIF
jgi:serine/threonine protein kinase